MEVTKFDVSARACEERRKAEQRERGPALTFVVIALLFFFMWKITSGPVDSFLAYLKSLNF